MVAEARAIEPTEESGPGVPAYQALGNLLRRRGWWIACGALAGLVLAVLYCVLFGPWYESSAQVLVLRKRLETSPISGPDQGRPQEDYLSTHILLMTSPRVVGQAVARGKLQQLKEFRQEDRLATQLKACLARCGVGGEPEGEDQERVARQIIRSLSVGRDPPRPGINPSNEVLTMEFEGKVAEEGPAVLNAVIDSYQAFLKETYRNINAETVELIAQARDVVQKDLEGKEAAYQKFLQDTPPVWRAKDGSTVQEDRLFTIDARRSALHVRQSEIEASLAMMANAQKSGRNPLLVREVTLAPAGGAGQSPVGADPANGGRSLRASLEEELIGLQLEETKLLGKYGAKHPEVQAVHARWEAVRRIVMPGASSSDRAGTELETGEGFAKLKVELLKQELADLKVAEQSLGALFEREQKAASQSFLHGVEDEAHRKGIERSRLLYDSILHRLEEINSVRDFGGYETQVIGAPQPGEPRLRKYFLVLGLGLFGGLLLGAGSAYWAHSHDTRVRTPQEVRQVAGWPVVGEVPGVTPGHVRRPKAGTNGKAPESLLGTHDRGTLADDEAYRALQAALSWRAAVEGYKVIQVTSPTAGAGKTTLAANLALALAKAGKSVVVVDADFRRPRLHEVYQLPADVGLASVLAGAATLADVVRQGPVAGLAVLPCGRTPANPAEVLAAPGFKEVVDDLRQRYDFVLIDTPPLLEVPDPCIVAERADRVLLSLPLARTDRDQCRAARDLLADVGARVLGVVVSGGRRGPTVPAPEAAYAGNGASVGHTR
jgi:capsular exopolysaccharide synthesis family protein